MGVRGEGSGGSGEKGEGSGDKGGGKRGVPTPPPPPRPPPHTSLGLVVVRWYNVFDLVFVNNAIQADTTFQVFQVFIEF